MYHANTANFKTRSIIRDKKSHFIMIKGLSIQNITTFSMYTVYKYVKQKLIEHREMGKFNL
jgi:hypothetical protein